jgi:hypothetical protein
MTVQEKVLQKRAGRSDREKGYNPQEPLDNKYYHIGYNFQDWFMAREAAGF